MFPKLSSTPAYFVSTHPISATHPRNLKPIWWVPPRAQWRSRITLHPTQKSPPPVYTYKIRCAVDTCCDYCRDILEYTMSTRIRHKEKTSRSSHLTESHGYGAANDHLLDSTPDVSLLPPTPGTGFVRCTSWNLGRRCSQICNCGFLYILVLD